VTEIYFCVNLSSPIIEIVRILTSDKSDIHGISAE